MLTSNPIALSSNRSGGGMKMRRCCKLGMKVRRCCNRNPDHTSGEMLKSRRCKHTKIKRYDSLDSGYTVDLRELFLPTCKYFIRNNGTRVSLDDLKGKTIVLYIVPIDPRCAVDSGDTVDMIEAYHELSPLGGIEFLCVPVDGRGVFNPNNGGLVLFNKPSADAKIDYSAPFNDLFSAIPFPCVPFSDMEETGERVVHTFSVSGKYPVLSYWVIIDPTSTVVATRGQYCLLFKHFGGGELYPLSRSRIQAMLYEFDPAIGRESRYRDALDVDDRRESRKRLIRRWDQLLVSPTRDFLLSSNGDHVPVSSLKGKVIGLYFCNNDKIRRTPRMEVIKEAYREARARGYDFEIVQINYHYKTLHSNWLATTTDYSEQKQQHRYENIDWLTLPFKDPSCRKLQRIFKCKYDIMEEINWKGDCLVIIDDSRRDQVLFEFSGAEIIQQHGIEAYPFTRQSVYELEYTRLTKEAKLQLLFPPGLCQFIIRRADGGGFDLVNDSQLEGKRVLVLFSLYTFNEHAFPVLSTLKSMYHEQAEEDKFEVVWVSMDNCVSQYIKLDMPWLVHPYSPQFAIWCACRVFKSVRHDVFAAFGKDGKVISMGFFDEETGPEMLNQFPFFPWDLRGSIKRDVRKICSLTKYYKTK